MNIVDWLPGTPTVHGDGAFDKLSEVEHRKERHDYREMSVHQKIPFQTFELIHQFSGEPRNYVPQLMHYLHPVDSAKGGQAVDL